MRTLIIAFLLGWVAVGFGGPIQSMHSIVSKRRTVDVWDIGAHEFSGTGSTVPAEFDVSGAEYYAVAPAGYTYDGTQDTNYSTRKYNTLSAAEAALTVTPTTPLVINIIGDWTGVTDTTAATFTGVTTTAANFISIRTIGAARHQGVYSSSSTFYRISAASRAIRIMDNYVRLDGAIVEKSASSANGGIGLELNPGTGAADIRCGNCIVKGHGLNATRSEYGIGAVAESSQAILAYNCIIFNLNDIVTAKGIEGTGGVPSDTVHIYSCVAIGGSGKGIQRGSGTLIVKNSYASSTSGTAYDGIVTQTTCASSDTTGSVGLQSIAHSTANFTNVTSGSEDYRLVTGSALINVGTDTTGDASPLNFTTDIAGATR